MFAQSIGELNLLIAVRGFGILGGGAVLFFGSSLVGTTIPAAMLGENGFCQHFASYACRSLNGQYFSQNFTKCVKK